MRTNPMGTTHRAVAAMPTRAAAAPMAARVPAFSRSATEGGRFTRTDSKPVDTTTDDDKDEESPLVDIDINTGDDSTDDEKDGREDDDKENEPVVTQRSADSGGDGNDFLRQRCGNLLGLREDHHSS